MADIIAGSLAWLAQKQKTHLSRTVTYRRGSAWVEIDAMVGRWEYEQTDFDGRVLRAECRDYLFLAADLVLGGDLVLGDERTLPTGGDTIEETAGGRRYIYEVMSPGKEPCYRYENDRATLRVHVKDKKIEDVV